MKASEEITCGGDQRMTTTRTRPLQVGLILPDTEHQMNGESARWSDFRAMARLAEEIGIDSLWVTDHLIHRSEPKERTPEDAGGDWRELEGPWECWSMLTALAAITERVEIGPLVICTSFRNPALLAKMADTLDEISDGRLILGLGAGWNEPEYRAFGYPFDYRVSRFEESLTIIAGLLRDGEIDFDSRFYQAKNCILRPRGPRPSGLPIMIGSTGTRMIDLAARHADQWNVWFSQTNNELDRLKELLRKVDAACEAVDRDPATLPRTAAIKIEVGPHAPSTMSAPPIRGTPEELADALRAHAEAGIAHVQVWLEPNTVDGIKAFAPVLELLDQS
jgi:probable F420-dependent oxidoreductase